MSLAAKVQPYTSWGNYTERCEIVPLMSEWLRRELELVRDTLMDDARERVDELGEEATQNESLGAALDQAYAARFGGSASSATAAPKDVEHSSALLEATKEAAADQSSPGELVDTAMQASEDGQPDLAKSEQAADAQVPSSGGEAPREPHQAAITAKALEMAEQEATAASENDAKTVEPLEESAKAADEQQGGAAAAAGVHAVPAEAAVAAASAPDAAAAAPPTGDDAGPSASGAAAAAPLGDDAAAVAASASAQDAAAPSSAPNEAADGHAEKAEPEQELPKSLDELGRRILDWHWSHLEYGCSAPLHKVRHCCMPLPPTTRVRDHQMRCVSVRCMRCMAAAWNARKVIGRAHQTGLLLQVSLAHWNQDEEYGGFGGPHCMVVGGYGAILAGLAQKLDIRFNKAVTAISEEGDDMVITTADGMTFSICLTLCTLLQGIALSVLGGRFVCASLGCI